MNFGPEWLVVLGIIVLLFGAKKLPELARSMGRSSAEFKKGIKEGQTKEEPTETPPSPAQPGAVPPTPTTAETERPAE